MAIKQISNSSTKSKSLNSDEWHRPSDWLQLPEVLKTEEKVVGLLAIFDGEPNDTAIVCQGAYTVDWGDGSAPENFASNVKAFHSYDYNDVDLAGTECSRGYKQAIVTITPQSGQILNYVSFDQFHPLVGDPRAQTGYVVGWLDIIVSSPALTGLHFGGGGSVRHYYLEQVQLLSRDATFVNFTNVCRNLIALQSVPNFDTTGVTSIYYTFAYCYALKRAPEMDTSSATSLGACFVNNFALEYVPHYDTSSVTSFASTFNGCYSLKTIPDFDTSNVTNFRNMFYSAYGIEKLPVLDISSATDLHGLFRACTNLKTVEFTGAPIGITSVEYMFQSCFNLMTITGFNIVGTYTSTIAMFQNCYILEELPLFDTSTVTLMNTMFTTANNLRFLPAYNFSGVTTVPLANTFTPNCSRMLFTGLPLTFTVANNKMEAPALNVLYTNLPTVVGQTITVTGNVGVSAADPTIATAKGWTVVG